MLQDFERSNGFKAKALSKTVQLDKMLWHTDVPKVLKYDMDMAMNKTRSSTTQAFTI